MNKNNNKSLSQIPGFQHFDLGKFLVRSIQNEPPLQPSTKHQYTKAIENYLDSGGSLTDPSALAEYAASVSTSARAFLAAAVNRMAQEME